MTHSATSPITRALRSRAHKLRLAMPTARRRGFTLVEVLAALVVMGTVAALLSPLVLGSRRMVQSDQLRTSTNQGVRASADMIGSDIRMAGERFPSGSGLSLPPIEIIPGASGNPDEIVLRRNLWEATFPVCNLLLDNTDPSIWVVRLASDGFWTGPNGPSHPECGQPLDTNGWPVNLAQAKELADTLTTNGVLRGYVYDPANDTGEFLDFSIANDADTDGQIDRVGSAPITGSYPLDNRPLIYILEERHYRIRNQILELVLNGQTGAPLAVAAGITNLRAQYVMNDGTVTSTLPAGTTWRDINSVEVALTGQTSVGPEVVQRSLTGRFFPRNVLSR